MFQDNARFQAAILRFDAENQKDPRRIKYKGAEYPKGVLYSRQLTRWVERLDPNASEAVRLAARCQNLRQWEVPRENYPKNRLGYLQWRQALAQFHKTLSSQILSEAGYDASMQKRVQALLQKKESSRNQGLQILQDAICLLFLEHEFSEFAQRICVAKFARIIRRMWDGMSSGAQQIAVEKVLQPADQLFVEKALSFTTPPKNSQQAVAATACS